MHHSYELKKGNDMNGTLIAICSINKINFRKKCNLLTGEKLLIIEGELIIKEEDHEEIYN